MVHVTGQCDMRYQNFTNFSDIFDTIKHQIIEAISVVTFNARGLGNRTKRRALFRHLHIAYPRSIIAIQETHSKPDIEGIWKSEWGGQIFFSHCSESAQAGIMILLPHGFNKTVSVVCGDVDGRLLSLQLDYTSDKLLLIGVYAPSIADQSVKCSFLAKVRDLLVDFGHLKTIVIGDFNIKLGPLDSDNLNYRPTRATNKLRDILEEFSMDDAWMEIPTCLQKKIYLASQELTSTIAH